jgi:hypothetical protein
MALLDKFVTTRCMRNTLVLAALVVVALVAAGLAAAEAGFLSFTGPDGPLGRSNTPLSSPAVRARLMWLLNCASVVPPRLLLDWMYFLMA